MFYSLGFPTQESMVKKTKALREMDFGEKDGLHFDGLSEAEKAEFSSPDFHAPGGESWQQVRLRVEDYFGQIDENGSHLVFTHGGPIVTVLQDHGVSEIPNTGSIFCVDVEDNGRVRDLLYEWQFPIVVEDN